MSCSIDDLKAYVVGEVTRQERSVVEDHVRGCQSCREELDRLNLTRSALASLEDEEIPRRIAFVSDRVFEPRWWQTMWHSGPVMGFASAAVLAAAILVHGFARPAAGGCGANREARRKPSERRGAAVQGGERSSGQAVRRIRQSSERHRTRSKPSAQADLATFSKPPSTTKNRWRDSKWPATRGYGQ